MREGPIHFNFKADSNARWVHIMLLRERSGSTDRGCPRASSTRRAVPERTSRRRSRRSPSSSHGRYACAAARSCRSSARWPCAPRPLRNGTASRRGRTSRRMNLSWRSRFESFDRADRGGWQCTFQNSMPADTSKIAAMQMRGTESCHPSPWCQSARKHPS